MELIAILIIAALVFGLCFLADKVLGKVFRGKKEHRSGLSVKLSKRFASIGLIVAGLGLASVFVGDTQGVIMYVAGGVLLLTGICLIVYYLTFGVYYDEDGFILSRFGRKSQSYTYADIENQQLFNSYGNIVIELQLKDGRTVQLQSTMTGVYPFMDKAFQGWLRQRDLKMEDCDFYDPRQSCWFPPAQKE